MQSTPGRQLIGPASSYLCDGHADVLEELQHGEARGGAAAVHVLQLRRDPAADLAQHDTGRESVLKGTRVG